MVSPLFFRVQTDVEAIVNYGTQYSTICLGASFGIFLQFCFERLLQSTGRSNLAMCIQLLGAVINILIFGLLGFPRLEVAGAAVATVAGQIIAAIAAMIMNIKKNPDIHLSIKKVRWDTKAASAIYKVGFPSIIMQSIGSVMTFGMNRILIGFTVIFAAILVSELPSRRRAEA